MFVLFFCQRAYSIRTRIKTRWHLYGVLPQSWGQRAYSIRTRIKTAVHKITFSYHHAVREHIPLEQGLRPDLRFTISFALSVREHIPLEQGLRQKGEQYNNKKNSQRAYSIRTRIKTQHILAERLATFNLSESIFH